MQPITLRMAGVRTYHQEHTIDFGGPGLIAVIGDTGAGKSSLLEGLTGALYGACTWDNRGIGELISDRAHTAQLELTFVVAGQTWTVSRSASRNNYPPSRHLLHCHDTGEKITGERAVTRRVTSLLGLTCKQFLRVVILPQNRFMELLNSPRTERNPILKGIFRLDDLDQVRANSERLCDTLEPKLTQVRLSRAKLADDPATRLADAHARREAAAARRHRLAGLRAQITAEQQAMSQEETAAAEIRGGLENLTAARARAGDIEDTLGTAARSATILDGDAAALADHRARLARVEARAQAALDAATAAGEDAGTLAATRQAVTMLTEDVPALITARRTLAEHDHELALRASELRELRVRLRAHDEELAAAVAELSRIRGQAAQARRTCEDARTALITLAAAAQAAAKAAGHSDRHRLALVTARAQARHASSEFSEATNAAQAAEERLADIRRHNAAAHAAADSQPGDPCPVCARPLPGSFAPPISADETAARAAADELRERASGCNGAASAAAERARRTAGDLADAIDGEAARLSELAAAAAAVADRADTIAGVTVVRSCGLASVRAALSSPAVTGEPAAIREAAAQLALNPLDEQGRPAARAAATPLLNATRKLLAAQIADLISPLADGADQLAQRCDQAGAGVDEIRERITAIQAQSQERSRALAADRQRLAAQRSGLVSDAIRVAAQLTALPPIAADIARAAELTAVPIETLSPASGQPGTARGAPADGFVLLPSSDSASFAAGFRSVATRVGRTVREAEARLSGHQRELRDARRSLNEVGESERLLAADRAQHVTRPVRKAAAALQTIQTRAADLATKLSHARAPEPRPATRASRNSGAARPGTDGTTVPAAEETRLPAVPDPGDVTVAAFRAAATALLTACDGLTTNANSRLSELSASAQAKRGTIATLLDQHELADPEDLHQAEVAAAGAWEVADADVRRFGAEQPVAAALDGGIAEAASALDVLRAVAKALTSAQFVDYVIGRRATALLQVASTLLGQLTGGGYAFAEDFRIVDRQTNTERDVRTLSGGETFLASLALALGLVELAGRGGGRIDSLFLDEGFGSLDATLLPDALDLLRSHVSTSRLVCVISHLHSVAADLDRVLLVTKQVHGSHARWLEPAERERLLADEVAAGLLR